MTDINFRSLQFALTVSHRIDFYILVNETLIIQRD